MYRTIVVGTDGSPTATGAVDAAITLARELGSHLHIVCADNSARVAASVAASAGVAMSSNVLDDVAQEHVTSVLEAAASLARAQGVATTLHPSAASAADTLVTVATAEEADLVIVGNRGMHGPRRLLGSVPNHVAHHAPCAVMIVPTT